MSSVPAPTYTTTGSAVYTGTVTAQGGNLTVTNATTPHTAALSVDGAITGLTESLSTAASGGGVLQVSNTTSAPTSANVNITSNAAADKTLAVQVTGDTQPRLTVDSNGRHGWGPGGSTGTDTNLYRSAAATLTTDGSLAAGANLSAAGTSTLTGNVTAGASLSVAGTSTLTGAVTTAGTLGVGTNLTVTGTSTLTGTVTASGAINVGTNLSVTGTSTLTGGVTASGNLTVAGSASVAGITFPAGVYYPSDHGLAAWTYDPTGAVNTTLTTSGTLYLARVPIRFATTLTKAYLSIATAAAGVTANQNFVGLYDSGGSLRASTAAGSIDAGIASPGLLTATFSASYSAPAGMYWIAFVNNATTPTTLGRSSSFLATPNAGLAAAAYRFAVNGTGLTSLPATITPGNNSLSGMTTLWAAVS
ncbi:beta strand repeat-containing protein [Kitasatospora sp. NPDC094028]